MCSCDFFNGHGNEHVVKNNILLITELLNILYKEGNYIKLYSHEYYGRYDDEHLHKAHKEKVSLLNFLSLLGHMKQDVLYIIY